MLKETKVGELKELIPFCWELARRPETNSYLLRKSMEEIRKSFLKSYEYPEDRLLTYEKDGKVCGVIYLIVEKKEKFLSTGAVYIARNFEEAMAEILSYIKQNYPDFTAFFGFPKENIPAITSMERAGLRLAEASDDMRMHRDDFTGGISDSHVKRITEAEFPQYAGFHDENFEGLYWTAARLAENLEKWRIYAYYQDDEIVAGVFMVVDTEGCWEIFGLGVSEGHKGQGIQEILLRTILGEEFKRCEVNEEIVYFVEEGDTEELEAAKAVGFTYANSYRGYEWKSLRGNHDKMLNKKEGDI